MAFLNSFVEYFITMVVMAAIAVAGVFAGKKLRDRKDAKKAEENQAE